MDQLRLDKENAVISHYMNGNGYEFGNTWSDTPYLRIAARSNSGKVYVLRIEMKGYPNTKPNAYVEMMLRDCHGNLMNKPSSSNHTLEPHRNNWTQICHYHPSAWNPTMSLWMVYTRCVLWLNIYEQTLRTGKNMDYYLGHMDENYRY